MLRLTGWVLLSVLGATAGLIQDVRSALARNDFGAAHKAIADYRAKHGVTAEMLEALSWLGRGALAAARFEEADEYAAETRRLALELLKTRPLDQERHLPIALGASIEVHAQALAAGGRRAEAVSFLEGELAAWRETSIRTRIQKNINLLTLEGRPAPPLEMSEHLGGEPLPRAAWKGRVVLLFFWAHWCRDCKEQAPILARILEKYGARGLLLIAPTQRYGYVAGGKEAGPSEETEYIAEVWRRQYQGLGHTAAPLSEENFRVYGASTTPTLVLVDGNGLVRLYHPGRISYEDLDARLARLWGDAGR